MQYINMRIQTAHQVFGNLKKHFDAACCTFASLQRLLSASFALPRRLRRDAILGPRGSRRSARTRREQTGRTHVWCLLRQRRNDAARGARRKIAILAAPCLRISVPLSRRTEGVRRLRFKAEIARHQLRLGFRDRLAAPTLR